MRSANSSRSSAHADKGLCPYFLALSSSKRICVSPLPLPFFLVILEEDLLLAFALAFLFVILEEDLRLAVAFALAFLLSRGISLR